ncbi:MAG: alpha/beta hydrolase [Gammaproteobacteria bacterium]|nr:alpha/beta hydrolase [Gammaproteobacteria bacterium]
MNERDHELVEHDSVSIAYQCAHGAGPYVMFLPGFNSHMFGAKAEYLRQLCASSGNGYVRLDYRGHGLSSGRLEDGTISQWLADARAVIAACGVERVVAVGASMGAWIALLLAKRQVVHIDGVIGVGGAPDATVRLVESLDDAGRVALARDGIAYRPSRYGDGPYPVTAAMVDDGRAHGVLSADWTLSCPLRLLHGLEDPDVDWQVAVQAVQALDCHNAQVQLLKGGDHRLSKPEELAAMGRAVEEVLALASRS